MSGNRRTPVPPTPPTELPLVEVFSSVQGEGPLLGYRQVFVRLSGCNLGCAYCDTLYTPTEQARLEQAPGSGQFRTVPNPVALESLTSLIADWCGRTPGLHHSISLTGGEPLLHAATLVDWLPVLRQLLPVYLETNGTLAAELERVRGHIDYLSMDFKLESAAAAGDQWERHEAFLRVARGLTGYAKVVVDGATAIDEIVRAARLLSRHCPEWELVLQPVTRQGRPDIPSHRLLQLQTAAAGEHGRARIIPQIHPLLSLL